MYYFITASKDTTLYYSDPNQNTGLDEILEINKFYVGDNKELSRSLIYFDITDLQSKIVSGSIRLDSCNLVLRETESEEIPLDFDIYIYPVSQSWDMGKGTKYDGIEVEGATWNYRTVGSEWVEGGTLIEQGGTYYTDTYTTIPYTYETKDINADISDIVGLWLTGSIDNNGIIIKHDRDSEDDNSDYGSLKFFSKETHTIYQPKLMIGWDDSFFQIPAQYYQSAEYLLPISDENIKISISNFKKEYYVNTIPRFRLKIRELYPQKTFNSTFIYNISNYIPISSYYQIRDYHSNDIIIPFGEYSKISCSITNNYGNYFDLNLSNWETDRIYSIEFKVIHNNTTMYFDDDYTFKVIDK